MKTTCLILCHVLANSWNSVQTPFVKSLFFILRTIIILRLSVNQGRRMLMSSIMSLVYCLTILLGFPEVAVHLVWLAETGALLIVIWHSSLSAWLNTAPYGNCSKLMRWRRPWALGHGLFRSSLIFTDMLLFIDCTE